VTGSKTDNLTWHVGQVTASDRAGVLGHGAACLWLTGLSGSGKSTLARALEQALLARGCAAYVLDGDNLRLGLNSDLSFAAGDRAENIRRVGELAALFVDAGLLLTTAFISPYRADRAAARQTLGDRFIEVHLNPGLDVCEQRDPKGLYARARAGEIADFTGISAPYEAPEAPELVLDTGQLSLDESVAVLIAYLEERGILR
jgi:adenylylsulfate kinase